MKHLFLAVRLQHAFDKPIALSKSNAKMEEDDSTISIIKLIVGLIREGANKQVISSQADSLIKISRIWAD
ncbi:hypothetical protein, partial [Escherichia coli]|uniref:hypothetical protein n=4 Tax=Escherichia coli TaxID=562 RepID=UPI0023B0CF5D